jgi:hypothetical protein
MVPNTLRECGLHDLNSFYHNKSVNTWASTFNEWVFALDNFISRPQGKKLTITDTKVSTEGAQSDHLPVHLNLRVRVNQCARWKYAHPRPKLKKKSSTSIIDYILIQTQAK